MHQTKSLWVITWLVCLSIACQQPKSSTSNTSPQTTTPTTTIDTTPKVHEIVISGTEEEGNTTVTYEGETEDKPTALSLDSISPPNIIILLPDDLGWNDVSYHGSKISTPHIDQLAKDGIELNRFYTYHSCTPSRVGLLTGRYPGRLGIRHVFFPEIKGGLPEAEETLAEFLATQGYKRRACIGKWHLGHSNVKYHPLNQGFTYFYGHYGGSVDYFEHKRYEKLDWHRNFDPSYDEGYSTNLITREAVQFIEESPTNEPFFLYLPFNAPHNPLQAPEEYLNQYGFDKNKAIYSNSEIIASKITEHFQRGQGNTKRQTYSAMVSSMDAAIGRILQALEDKGVADNTLVIFFSDNGASETDGGNNRPLRGKKGSTFEGGLRVPAIVKWPNGFTGGRKEETVMGYVDILSTIRGILNVTTPPTQPLDGINVFPILRGDTTLTDRTFYLSKLGLTTQKWKLAHNKLFDIENDMSESKNLAKKEPKVFAKLTAQLKELSSQIEVDSIPIDRSYKLKDEWKMQDN